MYGKQATNPWSRFFLEKLTDAILIASDVGKLDRWEGSQKHNSYDIKKMYNLKS